MYVLFECVAEAVMEKGLRGVAECVPGGGLMFDIAKATWEKYRSRCQMAKMHEEVQHMVQATPEEIKEVAAKIAKRVAVEEMREQVEMFLTQIPAAAQQSLKRKEDPTGTTVPATFSLRGPEDMAKLLPPALPRFKPGDPLPGKAGWLLEKQLGIGGFGEVWLARKSGYESLLGAVKFCRSLDTRDRDLLHESKVIDQLLKHGDHPNIVKLMDVHLEGDAPWLMYEYVEGGDLTDLIHQWSALPPSERQQKALAALQELAAAIGHFHRLDPSIVHRDLKPANILRDKSGRLRITDFGISGIAAKHMIEDEASGTTTRAGRKQFTQAGAYTPMYAPKQQIDGEDPNPRDDVHALGVVGYQMFTGQVAQGVGPDFAEDLKEAGIPEAYVDLLRRCTAAKAERRPADGGGLIGELNELILASDATEIERKRVAKEEFEAERCRVERENEEIRQRELQRRRSDDAEVERTRLRVERDAEETRRHNEAKALVEEREREVVRIRHAQQTKRNMEAVGVLLFFIVLGAVVVGLFASIFAVPAWPWFLVLIGLPGVVITFAILKKDSNSGQAGCAAVGLALSGAIGLRCGGFEHAGFDFATCAIIGSCVGGIIGLIVGLINLAQRD
jgi:hypothetical protein